MQLLLKLSGTLRQFVSQEILGKWLGTNYHEMLMQCSRQLAKLSFSIQQMSLSEVQHHQALTKMLFGLGSFELQLWVCALAYQCGLPDPFCLGDHILISCEILQVQKPNESCLLNSLQPKIFKYLLYSQTYQYADRPEMT